EPTGRHRDPAGLAGVVIEVYLPDAAQVLVVPGDYLGRVEGVDLLLAVGPVSSPSGQFCPGRLARGSSTTSSPSSPDRTLRPPPPPFQVGLPGLSRHLMLSLPRRHTSHRLPPGRCSGAWPTDDAEGARPSG